MVLSLKHLALSVPDLKVGADFYAAFGLNKREAGDRLAFRCDKQDHDEIILFESGRDRAFHHISFVTDDTGLKKIAGNLQARDIQRLEPPYQEAYDGLWFRDLDGNLVNVHAATLSPAVVDDVPDINRPGVITRLNKRGCPSPDIAARPRRFAHMILFTPDVARLMGFYIDVVGMQLSDTIVDEYGAFLRTAGDSDHHVLGFLKSTAPGFHHASFEMGSIDDSELAAVRLINSGVRHAWGPGRHAIGSNYFHYFRDPWNGLAEFFYDIDYISGDCAWEPSDWSKKDGMFLWSADGPPPPDFGTNYEAP